MGLSGDVFRVQLLEVGAESSQFQFCVFVCWTNLAVGVEIHRWVVETKGLVRRVLSKVGSSGVVIKQIDGFVDVL